MALFDMSFFEMAQPSRKKQVVVISIDDSDQNKYALNWTLDHFFPSSIFKLVLIHSRPTATSVVGFAGPGAPEILPIIDCDLRKNAARILEDANILCLNKCVDNVIMEIVEGDPRNVLCDAVDKYRAAMLIVGSHDYEPMKRVVLGSVSEYCARHAKCTVMIVRNSTDMEHLMYSSNE